MIIEFVRVGATQIVGLRVLLVVVLMRELFDSGCRRRQMQGISCLGRNVHHHG